MPSQITTYKCPACTGPLHYVGESGKLECDFCGSTYDVVEIEALFAEKEKKAQEAYAAQQQKEKAQPDAEQSAPETEQWDRSDFTDWGGDSMQAYQCPSCGAELICDQNTAATSCPYCGNPTVIPGKFTGALKPELLLPFKLTREQAKDALRKHYKGKRLLPKLFSAENKIDEIKGVYVPFWMFDSQTDADITMQAQRTSVYREGDYRVTKTSHYHVQRAGTVTFEKIPVDASSKMPDDYMDAIEPFDFGELCPFSTAYLPGFLADKYDVSAEDCSDRAEERMIQSAISQMKADAGGYDSCIAVDSHVDIHKGKVHYAMIPVYLLNTRWKDKRFLFAMNGQTGKMVSELPVSWGKFWAWFGGITVPLTAVIGTILYFML